MIQVSVEQLDRWYRVLRRAIEIGQILTQTRGVRIAQKEQAQEIADFESELEAMERLLGYDTEAIPA